MTAETELRQKIDATIEALAHNLRDLLFDKTVVPVVAAWLKSSDSIAKLESDIERRVKEKESLAKDRIETAFSSLATELGAALAEGRASVRASLDLSDAQREIGSQVATIVAAVSTLVVTIISGGAGTALLAEGPPGWILGAVLAAVVLVKGKDSMNKSISKFMHDKPLPQLLKRSVKRKVQAELELRAPLFEQQLRDGIRQRCQPLYDSVSAKAS